MKSLWMIAWALALTLLLAEAGAAQDKNNDGVAGYEVFSSSTPGGGGTLESQGLTGERTPWSITHVAPSLPGAVNVVVTYYDSKESRDKAKEKEKEQNKKKKDDKKRDGKKSDPPPVPTYDPRFYEYKDGKLAPKTQSNSDFWQRAATNSGSLTANGGNSGGHTATTYDKFGNPSTPTYDPRFFEYKDGKLVPKTGNSIQGMVVPDSIYDRQPFSFAIPQYSNQTVSVQTVEGVVVQDTSTDKYGRVSVGDGLPAGAYLISLGSGAPAIGRIEIKPRIADTPHQAAQILWLQNPPQALKLSDPFSLDGHGFSPNAANMHVNLNSSGVTEAPVVLAATEDQLKLAPIQQLRPGAAQLRVTNSATGQSTEAENVLLYNLHAELKRETIHSGGDQTQLVVTTEPANLPLTVKTNVVSGPVDFGSGRKDAEAVTSNGQAIFPVHAEHGSGPFQLTWELARQQDFVKNDDCRCNINIGRCQPEPDYFCIERRFENKWSCISSHK